MKVTVANDYGVYTNEWVMCTNVNADDVNNPCSIEHRDKYGIIWNKIMGKLNLKNKLERFIFVDIT